VAIETGTHSPWVSRMLEDSGHEVLVANARKVRLIYGEGRKTDRIDALRSWLGWPGSIPGCFRRSSTAVRAPRHTWHLCTRETHWWGRGRSSSTMFGARGQGLRGSPAQVHGAEFPPQGRRAPAPRQLALALGAVLEIIASLSERIREYDRKLEEIADELYPQTKLLRQVHGVGALSALTFVLTLEDPSRFAKSRQVGPYLGLVPSTNQSGESDPQRRISKQGNELTRKLLVKCAHYVLGPFGEDSDLRRHGEKIAQRGGKDAKRRAVVVARKLSVLLHRLWVTAEVYEPLYNASRRGYQAA
jgi:transposase